MKQSPSLCRLTLLSACIAATWCHALPSFAATINTVPASCNVLSPTPPEALAYMGSGRFQRTIDREVSTYNVNNINGGMKFFPFRVTPGSAVNLTLKVAAAVPANSGWQSVRPATMEIQQLEADGTTWTPVCSKTVSSGVTDTCSGTVATGKARVQMSTTGTPPNDKTAFNLSYNFQGPADAATQPEQAATTAVTRWETLVANHTTKAYVDTPVGVVPSELPGAFQGQALRLEITRTTDKVLVDPNGPKLKVTGGTGQDDATDFVCSNWHGSTAFGEKKVCALVGTALVDSSVHVPFQLKYGATPGTNHSATVVIRRQFANGYVQSLGTANDFAKTCY